MEVRVSVTERHVQGEQGAALFLQEAVAALPGDGTLDELNLVVDMSVLPNNAAISSSMLGTIVKLRKMASRAVKPEGTFAAKVEGTPVHISNYFDVTGLSRGKSAAQKMFEVVNRKGQAAEKSPAVMDDAEGESGASSDSHTL